MKTKVFLIVLQAMLVFSISGLRAQNAPDCEQNKKVIKEYLKAISGNVKDEKMLREFIDETDSIFIKNILITESTFPKYELIAEDLICENDIVAIRGLLKGKHLGPMGDIEPTGKEFNISIMVFYRLKKNKIVEQWIVFDNYARLKQLGITE